LVAGGGVVNGDIRLFDVETGSFQRAITAHRSGVRALAFSGNDTLLSGSYGFTINLRDLPSGAVLRSGMAHAGEVNSVAITSAGDLAVSSGGDHAVVFWMLRQAPEAGRAEGGVTQRPEAHEGGIWRARVAADGTSVVTASMDGTARVFDSQTGKLLHIFSSRGEAVTVAAISPDGRLLALASREVITIFDVQTGAERHRLQGHGTWISDLVWPRDGARLISVSEDGTAMVWDIRTGCWQRTLKGHTGCLRAVSISPDGSHAATAGDDAKVHVWDLDSGQLISVLHGHQQHVKALAWSRDGACLASAGSDDFIMISEPLSGGEPARLPNTAGEIWALAFAPDRFLAAGGEDHAARVFDLGKRVQIACLPCRDAVQALWFDDGGEKFMVVDRGGADLVPNVYITRIVAREACQEPAA
jgi:WD40 repeat protein